MDNLGIREDVVQRVSIKQIIIIVVDDIQGNIHSRNDTGAVEILTKRHYQAKKDCLLICWKRPGVNTASWIIFTSFTS